MKGAWPRVLPVGDRAATVELGSELSEGMVARVRSLDERVRAAAIPGLLETVPTYASLLVIYDRTRIPFTELKRHLLDLAGDPGTADEAGRLMEIPALYDGEDLEAVAEVCGLRIADVIELHSSREYRVLMLGFSTGFAYMGFVDERLRVPRRKTPRTRVPAGSIAVAGAQTGVYPRALPGGWNLLGRTSQTLFDAGKPDPSLLRPGDRVRFVPAVTLAPPEPSPPFVFRGTGVRVVEPGLLTTVQDAGRRGQRRLAVPWAGYADRDAAENANRCVGNSPGAPVIEVCGPGLRLAFETGSWIAISGAQVKATLERGDLAEGAVSVPGNVAVRARPSNTLAIQEISGGTRAYVAIAGLDAPRVLGSASTDLASGFLRPLQAGDRLNIGAFDSDRVQRDPCAQPRRRNDVRVILGPQVHHFDESTLEVFLRTSWRVGLEADRVGARLDGPRLQHLGPAEIISDGMVPGCVQVPPDGRPIVMLSDCPTTGGYPKIACVVSEDLPILSQAIPGQSEIRFVAVNLTDL